MDPPTGSSRPPVDDQPRDANSNRPTSREQPRDPSIDTVPSNRAGEGRPAISQAGEPHPLPPPDTMERERERDGGASGSSNGEHRPLMLRVDDDHTEPFNNLTTRPVSSMDPDYVQSPEHITPLPPVARKRTMDAQRQNSMMVGGGVGGPPGDLPATRQGSVRNVSPGGRTRESVVDWIVPEKAGYRPERFQRTVGERLQPTIDHAESERVKYSRKAQMTGLALNVAIGLQVLLGALTTGLSASLSGANMGKAVAALGGLSTLVASYLARARGSNEPELSITRVKDLDQFLREAKAFVMDCGHEVGNRWDLRIDEFRRRFEELLGNADGQRKLSTPV